MQMSRVMSMQQLQQSTANSHVQVCRHVLGPINKLKTSASFFNFETSQNYIPLLVTSKKVTNLSLTPIRTTSTLSNLVGLQKQQVQYLALQLASECIVVGRRSKVGCCLSKVHIAAAEQACIQHNNNNDTNFRNHNNNVNSNNSNNNKYEYRFPAHDELDTCGDKSCLSKAV